MSENEITIKNLETLKGEDVGRLLAKGINTIEALAMLRPDELAELLGRESGDRKVAKVLTEAWEKLGYGFRVVESLDFEKPEYFTTGCNSLNDILGGGIEAKSITEFAGEYRTGKTQTLLTTTACFLGEKDEGGVLWVDTEETMDEGRLAEIMRMRGYGPSKISKRLVVAKVINTPHLEFCVNSIPDYVRRYNIKLICVDSIIGTLRSEYVGREMLAERQQTLGKILRRLLTYAKLFKIAVAVTNQVVASPQIHYGPPIPEAEKPPTGGTILAHATTRVYLYKAGNARFAKLIDSPKLPERTIQFKITEKGITDVED